MGISSSSKTIIQMYPSLICPGISNFTQHQTKLWHRDPKTPNFMDLRYRLETKWCQRFQFRKIPGLLMLCNLLLCPTNADTAICFVDLHVFTRSTRFFIDSLKLIVFPINELVIDIPRRTTFRSHVSFIPPSNVPAGKPRCVRGTLKWAVSKGPLLKACTALAKEITA